MVDEKYMSIVKEQFCPSKTKQVKSFFFSTKVQCQARIHFYAFASTFLCKPSWVSQGLSMTGKLDVSDLNVELIRCITEFSCRRSTHNQVYQVSSTRRLK